MVYALDLYDLAGNLVAQQTPFASATASWELDGPGALEVSLAGPHVSGTTWLAGRRRVVLRSGSTPVWGGWLLGVEASFDPEAGESWTARCLGHAAALEERVVLGGLSFTSTVATDIAWGLIQHAQGQPSGSLGFTLGTITGTAPALTRHYCDADSIVEAIDELASRDPGGFDWEIDAQRRFNAWVGGRGTDRTATVSFGPADARELHATFDGQALATHAHALGQDPDGPCGPAIVTRTGALAGSYIRRDAVVERDTSDGGQLTAAADHEMAVRARARLRLEVVVEEGHDPGGLRNLGLGDKVTAVLHASLGGTQAVRLIGKQLSLESRYVHHWTLTFEVAS